MTAASLQASRVTIRDRDGKVLDKGYQIHAQQSSRQASLQCQGAGDGAQGRTGRPGTGVPVDDG